MKRNKKGFLTVNKRYICYNDFYIKDENIINKFSKLCRKTIFRAKNNQTLNNIFELFGVIFIFVAIISLFFCAV